MVVELKKALLYLHDLIFPKQCLGCRLEGWWLCRQCEEKIRINRVRACPICRHPDDRGAVCEICREKSYLSGLWILADYENPLVRSIIKAIKYDYICDLAEIFGRLAQRYFSGPEINADDNQLLPVPLHRRRQLERGFNQSEIIARELGRALGLSLAPPLLVRAKYLRAQARLSRADRISNMKNAFCYDIKHLAQDKRQRIILVDDVFTTGSTMQECARVLRENGFENIWGLVMARGK